LAVRKTMTLDSRKWCSSKPWWYDNTRIRKIYETCRWNAFTYAV